MKKLSPASKICKTLAGVGTPGSLGGAFQQAQFSEPGGLCLHPDPTQNQLVLADTNNHAIRILHLEREMVTTVSLGGGAREEALGNDHHALGNDHHNYE